MRYEPKKIGKSPEIMCFACFLCAAVMVLASNVRGIYGSGIMQGIAVAFLVAMIFFAVRYVFTSFRYEVVKRSKSEDAPVKSLAPEKLELRVARQQGKRAFVYENIINLGDIISFSELPEGKAGKRMIKAAGSGFLFKYKKNLAGGKCWLLVAKGEEKNIRIVLEINDDGVSLSDYLSAVARFNCENK